MIFTKFEKPEYWITVCSRTLISVQVFTTLNEFYIIPLIVVNGLKTNFWPAKTFRFVAQ